MTHDFTAPQHMRREDGSTRFAFVTFIMLNDSYLPGTLMTAYALRKQKTRADLLCMVTEEVSSEARYALGLLYDYLVPVEKIYVPHKGMQTRQAVPYMYTRFNALRLGKDGDLGYAYDKVVVLDSDLLPLKHYSHLFCLEAPAGILDENKYHFIEVNADNQYMIPEDVAVTGKWRWHRLYEGLCPHGCRIPQEITDRVTEDPENMGINGSLFVFKPDMQEFTGILADLQDPRLRKLISDQFQWPDMQYLTLRWSGQWTNIDLRFSGFNGYPKLSVLFGTHFAGFKPWYFNKPKTMECYARYDDFQLWFRDYRTMVEQAYPDLLKVRRLKKLLSSIKEFESSRMVKRRSRDHQKVGAQATR
jgi:alpha-N-acetylglucosamine transferase